MSSTNETNALWRAVRRAQREQRDQRERVFDAAIARLALRGVTIRSLGEYGWRLTVGTQTVDYWPRTGTWRTPRGETQGHGWAAMLDFLGVSEPTP